MLALFPVSGSVLPGVVVALRRVKPIAAIGRVVIGCLVPFILRWNEVRGSSIAVYRHQSRCGSRPVERVRPRFRRARAFGPGGLAILQPVAEAGRITPRDTEYRTIGSLAVTARDRVAVVARTAALGNAQCLKVPGHGGVVDAIRVCFRHRVEELAILANRRIILAHLIGVRDRAIQ